MKNLKVLTKLHLKVRRRTVLVSEQSLNNTFISCKSITLYENQVFQARKTIPRSTRNLVRVSEISVPLMCFQTCFGKRRLNLNSILNDRILTLRYSYKNNHFSEKRKTHQIIRPLLDLKRETITMVCKDFKMPVYPDQSNKSVQYSRNRIRKQIIPSIKYFINPQVESSLFKLAEFLNKEQFFLYSLLRNSSANVSL